MLDLASKIDIKMCLPRVSIISKGMILPRKTGIKNAPYQGGGVICKDGNLVNESVIYDLINADDQKQLLAFGCAYNASNIKVDERKVIYLGLAHQH